MEFLKCHFCTWLQELWMSEFGLTFAAERNLSGAFHKPCIKPRENWGNEVLLVMWFSCYVVFIDTTGVRIRNSSTPKWRLNLSTNHAEVLLHVWCSFNASSQAVSAMYCPTCVVKGISRVQLGEGSIKKSLNRLHSDCFLVFCFQHELLGSLVSLGCFLQFWFCLLFLLIIHTVILPSARDSPFWPSPRAHLDRWVGFFPSMTEAGEFWWCWK